MKSTEIKTRGNLIIGIWQNEAALLLLVAVSVGTLLRFFRLGTHELGIDESLAWAEASAPTITKVLQVQHQLDSGKLGLYELVLHAWLRAFGQSELAMRSLPALIGSLSIVLVFILTREILMPLSTAPSEDSRERRILVASAVCALIFAVALSSVEIARSARMYSMMLAAILTQVILFLRARRVVEPANYVGIAIFSALAVAVNFTAVLVVAAEALWLIFLLTGIPPREHERRTARPWLMAAALVAGMALLLPFFSGLLYGIQGVERGDYNWIRPPGRWEPLATFESSVGSWPFPLFVLLAILGGVTLWHSHRTEAVFLLTWLSLPPIILIVGSYLITPMFVTRYLIFSFIPFFIFTGAGIEALPTQPWRSTALVVLVSLSILRVCSDFRPGNNSWRDACRLALTRVGPDDRLGCPRNYYYLIAYYVSRTQRDRPQLVPVSLREQATLPPRVVIVSPTANAAQVSQLRREFPVILGRFRNVMVLSRPGDGRSN